MAKTLTLAVLTMVRNESSKLAQTLPVWSDFADGIIAIDDNSTDDTRAMLERAGADVYANPSDDPAWGNESGPRRLLFDKFHRSDYDYGFWLDADMIPGRNPRPLIEGGWVNGVLFRLFDLWSPTEYREDDFWFGHRYPRTWIIHRPPERLQADWSDRGIHCGHLPRNLALTRPIFAPIEYSLLHYAYSTPELREAKMAQYRSKSDILTEHERLHAESIGDKRPCKKPLPFVPQWPLDFSLAPVPA